MLENINNMEESDLEDDKVSELQKQVEQLRNQIKDSSEKIDNSSKLADDKNKEDDERKAQEALDKLNDDSKIKSLFDTIEKEDAIDYNQISTKEVLDIVADAFEKATSAQAKLLKQELNDPISDLTTKFEGIKNYLITQNARQGVADARSKYSDFDKFRESITDLYSDYPELTPEDAYLLAKSRKASKEVPAREIETEKPDSAATRASAERRWQEDRGNAKNTVTESPTKRFRKSLDDAVEKILSTRNE